MKKLTFLLLTLLSSSAVALPVSNPAEASLVTDGIYWPALCADFCDPCYSFFDGLSVRAGFYGDYVFDRFLEVKSGDAAGRMINNTTLYTNSGYLVINLWNRFDLFTSLGSTTIYLNANGVTFGAESTDWADLETRTGFSWSVGNRFTIYECGPFAVGAEWQYFFTRPDISRVTLNDSVSDYVDSRGWTFKFEEWQVGMGISYRLYQTIPYLAIKFSHANVDTSDDGSFHYNNHLIAAPFLQSQRVCGLVAGISLLDCDRMLMTAEVRFHDELAFYLNGALRF